MISTRKTERGRIARSPLARRFLGGAAWSVAGAILSSGITLVTMIFVARLLGKETYGQFVVVQSTLGMVGVFAGFGVGTAAIRYVAELRSRDERRLAHILALTERAVFAFGLIATVALALISEVIASVVLNSPELSTTLLIAASSVFFSALDGYQKSVLIGLEAMRAFATGTVLGAALSVPVMLVSAEMYGLNGVAAAMVVNAIIQAGISRFQMAGQLRCLAIKREPRGCMSEWQVLRDFAMPALLIGLLVVPTHWVCYALLANTPNGYAEIAVLGVAMQWFNVILFLPSVAGRVVLPILTAQVADKNHVDAKRLLLLAIGANGVVTVPVAIFAAVFSSWILGFYGAQFQNGSITMVIAVITASLLAVQTPVGNMVVAVSRMWLGAFMNFGWALVYVGFAYALLGYGSAGIVGAMGIAYLFHSIWTFAFANNLMNTKNPNLLSISNSSTQNKYEIGGKL